MSDNYTPQKTCVECGSTFPCTAEYFNQQRDTKDGFTNLCKDCAKKRASEWYHKNKERGKQTRKVWYEANKESDLARKRARNSDNPEFRQAAIERSKKFREENPERVKTRKDAWYKSNQEYHLSKGKEWRKQNPEQYKALNKAYYAKRRKLFRNAPGSHTAEDIRILYDEQEGRCAYCGITLYNDYHLDHIIPLIRGGSNNPDNLACTCAACNLSKGEKLLGEWTAWRGW